MSSHSCLVKYCRFINDESSSLLSRSRARAQSTRCGRSRGRQTTWYKQQPFDRGSATFFGPWKGGLAGGGKEGRTEEKSFMTFTKTRPANEPGETSAYLVPGPSLFLRCDICRSWSEKRFEEQDRNRAAERKWAGKFRQKLTTVVTVGSGREMHTDRTRNVLVCACVSRRRAFAGFSFSGFESDLKLLLFHFILCIKRRPFVGLYCQFFSLRRFCLVIIHRAYCKTTSKVIICWFKKKFCSQRNRYQY